MWPEKPPKHSWSFSAGGFSIWPLQEIAEVFSIYCSILLKKVNDNLSLWAHKKIVHGFPRWWHCFKLLLYRGPLMTPCFDCCFFSGSEKWRGYFCPYKFSKLILHSAKTWLSLTPSFIENLIIACCSMMSMFSILVAIFSQPLCMHQ